MADVSKSYGVGDTVYVAYPFGNSLFFSPQTRTVKNVFIKDGDNEAGVEFTDGQRVNDGAIQTVYDTEALCAAAIITDVILRSAATAVLDATLSIVSTAGQASTTLGRIG